MGQENTKADDAPAPEPSAIDSDDASRETAVESDEMVQAAQSEKADVESSAEEQAIDSSELDDSSESIDESEQADADDTVDELMQAQARAEKHWNLYLGARAEADNIKKRAERDVQNAHKFALERFINELLPVKDSLELGLSAASETTDMDKLIEGSELTLKMLTTALEKFAVEEVNPLGDKFDPQVHEAMAMQPSEEAEPNTVLQVIQKGYLLHGRLVRPALVIVSQAAQKSTE